MSRRSLLKGIAGLAAGALILPPTLEENVEAARRYWALDRTMVASPWEAFGRTQDMLMRTAIVRARAHYSDGSVIAARVVSHADGRFSISAPSHVGNAALWQLKTSRIRVPIVAPDPGSSTISYPGLAI
jgi:hypothetical protein